jgi:plasmid replication initiation protein
MSMLISNIKVEDTDFFEYTLKINEFKGLLENNNNNFSKQLKNASEELLKTILYLPVENSKDFHMTNFISSVKYESNNGIIIFKIDKDLKPFLLNLKDNFLQYELNNILSLSCNYSIKLYEIFPR